MTAYRDLMHKLAQILTYIPQNKVRLKVAGCPALKIPPHYSQPTWAQTYTKLVFSITLRATALVFQRTMIVEPHI
jgi:hypothetical protein